MATAQLIKEKVKVYTEIEKQTGVTLSLTNEEAYTLSAILGTFTGCPTTSLRRNTDKLYDALVQAGFRDCYIQPWGASSPMYTSDSLVKFNKRFQELQSEKDAKNHG